MTAPPLSCPPTRVTAGDAWTWLFQDSCYPSDTWTPSYAIVGPGTLSWDSSYAVLSNGEWTITIPPSITASLPDGVYRFTQILTSATDRQSLPLPTLRVLPDPAQEQGGKKSWAEQQLCDLETAITAMTQNSAISYYQIGRRIYQRTGLEVMMRERTRLREEVAAANSVGIGRRVTARFRPAGW